MKSINYVWALLLPVLFLISCSSGSDKLVGVWKIGRVVTEETHNLGDKAGEEFKRIDKQLQDVYLHGTLDLKADKTAVLKTSTASDDYTWKMNNETLELYKKGSSSPHIVLFPAVAGQGLFYMKDVDNVISARFVLAESNTAFIMDLTK